MNSYMPNMKVYISILARLSLKIMKRWNMPGIKCVGIFSISCAAVPKECLLLPIQEEGPNLVKVKQTHLWAQVV